MKKSEDMVCRESVTDRIKYLLDAHSQGLYLSDTIHALSEDMWSMYQDGMNEGQKTAEDGWNEAEGTVYKTHIKSHWTNIKIRIADDEAPPSGETVKILWSKK